MRKAALTQLLRNEQCKACGQQLINKSDLCIHKRFFVRRIISAILFRRSVSNFETKLKNVRPISACVSRAFMRAFGWKAWCRQTCSSSESSFLQIVCAPGHKKAFQVWNTQISLGRKELFAHEYNVQLKLALSNRCLHKQTRHVPNPI